MKTVLALLSIALSTVAVRADSTINPVKAFAWAGNAGWTNWRASAMDGVAIGEYVCSGHVYWANAGWVNMGSGAPADGIRYGNAVAGDFGVNLMPTARAGIAVLRGFAYGANIGWINFHDLGDPRLDLATGEVLGFAWSANCGWINLGSTPHGVATTMIAPGADTDADDLPDAYELGEAGNLTTLTPDGDNDADGQSDLAEYLADTSSFDATMKLDFGDSTLAADFSTITLTWTSRPTRRYRIETSTDLATGWAIALDDITPDGTATTRTIPLTADPATQFFRVVAFRPLAP